MNDDDPISLNFLTLVNQRTDSSKPLAILDEARKKEAETPTNFDEMKRLAISRRDNLIANARLILQEVIKKNEALKENSVKERDKDLEKSYKQCEKAKSMAAALRQRALEKFAEAEQLTLNEYNQANLESEEILKKIAEHYHAALVTAKQEYEKERALFKEKKTLA